MRTKTLLCMAALAAGVATSMAQNVYSLNIVGYANVPNAGGYSFKKAPFQVTTAVTNGANEILPANTGQYDGDQILIWTGAAWAASYLDSTQPSGFSDSGGNPVPAPILGNFQGWLYYNAGGVSNNLTFVGQVPTGTNSTTIPSSPEYSAKGSYVPFAGGVITSLGFANPGGIYDGDAILKMVVVGGVPKGFAAAYYDSTQPSGFSDTGGNQIPEPQIAVGEGFFFDNLNAGSVTWTQIFNP